MPDIKPLTGRSKLSQALALHPDVLEYVISLNPHDFNRLRSPILRKVMPPRISLRRIASMVGISEQEFSIWRNETLMLRMF